MPIKLMREAIKEAETNLLTDEGGPFGAVVVKNIKNVVVRKYFGIIAAR